MRTDRNYVRTAQDLERKYNFSGMNKNIEMQKEQLNKTNNELANYIKALGDIQNQVDEKITTWFFSGVPTLENQPASEWSEYDTHIGDMYYDKDTGYAYRFTVEEETLEDAVKEVYSWQKITDSDVVEALALANSAKDTADSKRRVFTNQPDPPYDNGDLWIHELELYRCQVSKTDGEFEENDFILATKYTDDTLANKVNDDLTVVRGTVLKVQEGVDEFKIEFESTTKTINQNLQENIEAVEKMSYSFGTDDLEIAKENDPVHLRMNNTGMRVYSYQEPKAIFNHNGSGIQKLIVVGSSQLGNLQIIKGTDGNGQACTDFHHLVSNIQELTDLEV